MSKNLAAYDVKRSLFTSHSIVRNADASVVMYFHGFEKIGHFWHIAATITDNGVESQGFVKMRQVEKMILSGDLIVSVKDMSLPCDTDEAAHPDAGKMVIAA